MSVGWWLGVGGVVVFVGGGVVVVLMFNYQIEGVPGWSHKGCWNPTVGRSEKAIKRKTTKSVGVLVVVCSCRLVVRLVVFSMCSLVHEYFMVVVLIAATTTMPI